ncbi:alpha/beta fold hydrolase [uncultured Thiodictyon sp.]|uniref:alpha/beta fold hydrolase n=1 Tax=uncultured Thiodictyon sp. TaxID=1846217 RepID=UPI0025F790A7|nr:alpha/beta fold hydrolase [uncultured Thiodictyon sp.]
MTKTPTPVRTPLPEALDAPRHTLVTRAGERLAWYGDSVGSGRPLVLVHSVNAAPSSFEVKPLFDHYRGQRPVYSLELPGFGHSERPVGPYSAERFTAALVDFLDQVVKQPADVVALSLSSEFAARAALKVAGRIASLALISPTGFGARQPFGPAVGKPLHWLLTLPGLGAAAFALVSSRRSINYYLGQSFVGKAPAAVLDYAYATSHQPGARHAPLMFLSMQLFTRDAPARLYALLPADLPVLAIADRDPYVTFEKLPGFVALHPNWQYETLAPHLGLPQWERLPELVAALDRFWAGAPTAS